MRSFVVYKEGLCVLADTLCMCGCRCERHYISFTPLKKLCIRLVTGSFQE